MSITLQPKLADDLQGLLVRRGFRCNLTKRPENAVQLYVSEDKEWSVCSRASDGRPVWGVLESSPDEDVWCVTVSTGSIITRRHGKVAIVGNCVGRVLRPSPGKVSATVVDLCGSVHEHGTPDMEREYSLTGKAISGVKRDAIRQCRVCGAVFLAAGAEGCPACGATLPRREQALPQSTGVGVVDIATLPKLPTRSFVVSIPAKFPGVCRACNERIERGEQIYWARGEKPRHTACP